MSISLRGAWLVTIGVTFVALSMGLLADAGETFSSSSYRWIFHYMTPAMWSVILAPTGVLAISAGVSRSQRRAQFAFAMVSLCSFGWAAGYVVAFVQGDLTNLSALVMWVMVAGWNLLVARSVDDEPEAKL